MKNTTTPLTRPTLRGLVLALAVIALSSNVARAVPYASCITNNGTTATFYLNELSDDVTVIYDGGGAGKTNDLGVLAKGPHSFSMTGHSSYVTNVTKVASVGWTLISDDTNPMNLYGSPRGVTVSQVSSNLSTFGRIYVADSATPGAAASRLQDATTKLWRTNYGKGVFVLNADQSDCLGQASTCGGTNTCVNTFSNGISFNLATPSTSSPFHLGFGPDNKLYMNCFGTVDATTWRSTNADCFGFELVLAGVGEYANRVVHSDCSTKPIIRGSTQDGSLKLWNLDGNLTNSLGVLFANQITEWDILGGPLPWNTPPTQVGTATAYSGTPDVVCDFNIGLDGKWFIMTDRADGTDRASIQEYDTDATTLLFDSFVFYGSPDPLRNAVACDLSPDGKTFSFLRIDNSVVMFALTNGVIDTSTLFTLTQPSSTSVSSPALGNGRQMCYDAAGNIYTVSSGQARLRVFAPGGFTVASTHSDGTFTIAKPSTTVSVAAITPETSMDTTQPPGVFTITRAGPTAAALPVGYTLTGTATNGVQYQLLSGHATIPATTTSVAVNVTAIPYTPAGPTRSVVLTINSSNTYQPALPFTATLLIIDTNTPAIHVAARDAQFYERTNDYGRFTLTRWGDTNVYLGQVNVTYAGTAVKGTHYYPETAYTNFNQGDVNVDVFVYPIHDGVVSGPMTVTATVAPALDNSYAIGTPATSGAITRVDSDDPPETVLWSDNLQSDTHANWTVLFATTNGAPTDFEVNGVVNDYTLGWPYDYSAIAVPPAPHSGADTHGLRMTVNKDDSTLAAAALNFYPNGKTFSGNYALRFDMFLIQNDTASTTEYALFGINHSGTKTNWFRGSTAGFNGVDPSGWNFDGVFYDVEADGSGLGDYVGYSSPTTAANNPTPITPGVSASALAGVFKSIPWTPGAGGGGAAANVYGSATPIWADVELKQVNGVIYWSINHTLIFAYTNTTSYKSGNIMLGYEDGYDSIGSSGGSVIYANARVISLANPVIKSIVDPVAGMTIVFQANAGDVPAQFTLQKSSPLAAGPYADVASTITSLGGGAFQAVKAKDASPAFYRIRRIE